MKGGVMHRVIAVEDAGHGKFKVAIRCEEYGAEFLLLGVEPGTGVYCPYCGAKLLLKPWIELEETEWEE